MIPHAQLKARLAGLFYLGTIVAGIYAQVGVRAPLTAVTAQDSNAAIAANILRNVPVYRTGEAADLVMLCCYIAVTTLLYELFTRTSRQIALVSAGFSLTGIIVLAVAGVLHLAPLALLDSSTTAGLDLSLRQALAVLSLDLHAELYSLSLVFFGFYCLLIGWLVWRSGLLPGTVGALMMIGGISHIIVMFTGVLAPDIARSLPLVMKFAPLVGEAALALWLLAFGIKETAAA